VPSSSIQPFGHNRHKPKIGGSDPPLLGGGARPPSTTKSPWPRPTSIPSGILIHPAIWPQHIWAKNWGQPPLGGGAGSPSNTVYLNAKFHLDPSNRLATVHKRHRKTDRHDRQRSDSNSIGRTVLLTVAQKVDEENMYMLEKEAPQYSGGCTLPVFTGRVHGCHFVLCWQKHWVTSSFA